MKSNFTRILTLVAFMFFLLGSSTIFANNPPVNKIVTAAPGNHLVLSVPANGLPASVLMCTTQVYRVNVSNILGTPENNVTLTVNLPDGIIPVPGAVTVNGAPVTFTTLPSGGQDIVVNIGTIAANPGNALVEIPAVAGCGFVSYYNGGGARRVFYKADYPGNSDYLNIVGNPLGNTIEFNADLPALNVVSVTPNAPSVTLGSTGCRVIHLINGGTGGLSTFDVFDTHGTDYIITSVSGATVVGALTDMPLNYVLIQLKLLLIQPIVMAMAILN